MPETQPAADGSPLRTAALLDADASRTFAADGSALGALGAGARRAAPSVTVIA